MRIVRHILGILYSRIYPERTSFRHISRLGRQSENAWIRKSSYVPGWLFPEEHELLYEAVGKAPEGDVIEIGSLIGKSTCIIAGALKDFQRRGVVYAIDPFTVVGDAHDVKIHKKTHGLSNTFPAFVENAHRHDYAEKVVPLATFSDRIIPRLKADVSLAFIDGLHEFEAVKNDFAMIRPLLVPQAIVLFHDARGDAFPGVAEAVDCILSENREFHEIPGAGSIRALQYLPC